MLRLISLVHKSLTHWNFVIKVTLFRNIPKTVKFSRINSINQANHSLLQVVLFSLISLLLVIRGNVCVTSFISIIMLNKLFSFSQSVSFELGKIFKHESGNAIFKSVNKHNIQYTKLSCIDLWKGGKGNELILMTVI